MDFNVSRGASIHELECRIARSVAMECTKTSNTDDSIRRIMRGLTGAHQNRCVITRGHRDNTANFLPNFGSLIWANLQPVGKEYCLLRNQLHTLKSLRRLHTNNVDKHRKCEQKHRVPLYYIRSFTCTIVTLGAARSFDTEFPRTSR